MRAVGGARVVMEKRMPLLPMSTRACRCVAACFRGDEEAILNTFFLVWYSRVGCFRFWVGDVFRPSASEDDESLVFSSFRYHRRALKTARYRGKNTMLQFQSEVKCRVRSFRIRPVRSSVVLITAAAGAIGLANKHHQAKSFLGQ